MVTGVLERRQPGVGAAARHDQALRGDRGRRLCQESQRHRPFRFAVGGVQRPQPLVAAVDVDGRPVGGQHRAGQHSGADGVAGPLADEQRRLPGVVLQPDQPGGRSARLPDAEHHRAVGRREGGRGRDRAALPGRRAIGQPARRIGRVDAVHQIQRSADHLAAMRVENQHLSQVGGDQQLAAAQKPWGGRHPDHRLAPARPLGRRETTGSPPAGRRRGCRSRRTADRRSRRPGPAAHTSVAGRCRCSPTPSANIRRGSAR